MEVLFFFFHGEIKTNGMWEQKCQDCSITYCVDCCWPSWDKRACWKDRSCCHCEEHMVVRKLLLVSNNIGKRNNTTSLSLDHNLKNPVLIPQKKKASKFYHRMSKSIFPKCLAVRPLSNHLTCAAQSQIRPDTHHFFNSKMPLELITEKTKCREVRKHSKLPFFIMHISMSVFRFAWHS